MATEPRMISSDEVANHAVKHFRDADQMRTFFSTVYHDPVTPPFANVATRERPRLIDEAPAMVALADFLTLRNCLAMASAEGDADAAPERFEVRLEEKQAWKVWHAMRALKKVADTPPGPDVLRTLVMLLPRDLEPEPEPPVARLLEALKSDDFPTFRAFERFFNNAQNN